MAKQIFIRIITWLGLMAGLTLLAMGVWLLLFHGSQTTASLKWLQLLQTIGTFLLPPILCAWMWDETRHPFRWLGLSHQPSAVSRQHSAVLVLLAVGIMICAMPGINLLVDLNGRIELPESLDFIEQKLQAMEAAAAALTERFLQADNAGQLLLNIGLMALLPALAEEMSFRGTLQQLLAVSRQPSAIRSQPSVVSHTAIWVTAIVFSAVHMQFYGFIPRMLMGAMFGYIFVWSGSLWFPILMHFTNNCVAVLAAFSIQHSVFSCQLSEVSQQNIADTIGAGDTWWLGVTSILITSLGLLIFYRRTHIQSHACAYGCPVAAEQES